ncbi:MAG: DUF2194 domain-containing protein [Candidatus Riflebacteria bacterium]|nr:DUF2194 domain-containing protein [Candidatus Riflebacteria bacterium]
MNNGGIVFIALPFKNSSFFERFGISINPSNTTNINSQGLISDNRFLRNIRIQLPQETFGATSLDLKFSDDWKILIRYLFPSLQPLLITREFGKGAIVYWNSDCLRLRDFRGYFLFSLLSAQKIGAMSIFNSTLFQIDDSPPPSYGIESVFPILGEPVDDQKFFLTEWYQEVLDLLSLRGIKPTHFLCFRYSGQKTEDFFKDSDRNPFFKKILDLIEARGNEIGLHGYNHIPLISKKPFQDEKKNQKFMKRSLESAKKLWKTYDLPVPKVYVPPNNQIDSFGKAMLREIFPSIREICGSYSGFFEQGNPSEMCDEIGPEKNDASCFNIPRFSRGYFPDHSTTFSIMNGVLGHGLINHFIQPDEVFDPKRGKNLPWELLLQGLENLLSFFEKLLPDSKKFYTGDFLIPLKNFLQDEVHFYIIDQNHLKIVSKTIGRNWFYIFSKNKPLTISGGKIYPTDFSPNFFHIQIFEKAAIISFVKN